MADISAAFCCWRYNSELQAHLLSDLCVCVSCIRKEGQLISTSVITVGGMKTCSSMKTSRQGDPRHSEEGQVKCSVDVFLALRILMSRSLHQNTTGTHLDSHVYNRVRFYVINSIIFCVYLTMKNLHRVIIFLSFVSEVKVSGLKRYLFCK